MSSYARRREVDDRQSRGALRLPLSRDDSDLAQTIRRPHRGGLAIRKGAGSAVQSTNDGRVDTI
jgi:hypothetical protein